MRVLRTVWPVLVLLLLVGLALFFFWRGRTAAAYGPLIAFCPGPDHYGYTCAPGTGYTYLPATTESFLYQDDGLVTLSLPFPFTFYGSVYTELHASSNGNIQFTTRNPAYFNQCLDSGPIAGMGDMIAPFWDDLDLSFYGYLRYDTVGVTPNRIFVVEWVDLPPYGSPDDRFTFAVQLFEGSNDLVFWYQDVAAVRGHNGRSATIGLQSERLGMALQYSCNQPAVADATALHFVHPAHPNTAVQPVTSYLLEEEAGLLLKGDLALLLDTVNQQGMAGLPAAGLPALNRRWLSEVEPRRSQWFWADMTGSGRDELIWLWQGGRRSPHLTNLAVLGYDETGQMAPLLSAPLAGRDDWPTRLQLKGGLDLTGDELADFVLHDAESGRLWLVTAAAEAVTLQPLALTCHGSVGFVAGQLVLSGCGGKGRQFYTWDGRQFLPLP
jgi:hypothetical protein